MVKLRNALLGAAVGLGIGAASIEHAEAKDFATAQSPDPTFPFERLAIGGTPEDIDELLTHINDWAYKDRAGDVAVELAKKYPYDVIKHNKDFLDLGVPWTDEVLRSALHSATDESRNYDIFRYFDVGDPRTARLFEESMDTVSRPLTHYYWRTSLGLSQQQHDAYSELMRKAISVEAAQRPMQMFRTAYNDQDQFAKFVPNRTKRKALMEQMIVNIIESGDDEDLKEMARYAQGSSDIRILIAQHYGWERFLEQCAERIPGAVLRSFRDWRSPFFVFWAEKKRMEVYRNATERDPGALIWEWRNESKYHELQQQNHRDEMKRLAGDAYTKVITEHLDEFHVQHLLTPEVMREIPAIDTALRSSAEKNPAQLLDALDVDVLEIDATPYLEIAARSAIAKRTWKNARPVRHEESKITAYGDERRSYSRYGDDLYTVNQFGRLPDHEELEVAWFKAAMTDIPGETLGLYFREPWTSKALDENLPGNLMYAQEMNPAAIDTTLDIPTLTFDERHLLLGSRAKDDFAEATRDAITILQLDKGTSSKLAYQLLWILEEAQPYEFSAWVKELEKTPAPNSLLDDWKKAVTKEQWDGLVKHADSIEKSKAYETLATSTIGTGFRFNTATLEELLGMNYHHRLRTTVASSNSYGAYEGKNFITVPMLAFETIATSKAFERYIDAHANDKLSFVTLCSTVQATWRRLRDLHMDPSPANIERALNDVEQQWEHVKNVEVFGPHTDVITIAHEEARFSNTEFIDQLVLGHGGNAKQVLFQGKGAKDESAILTAISTKKTKSITIAFHGHGLEQGLYLDDRTPIEPTELGAALIASDNIQNTRLILHSCHAYDFVDQLLRYLREKHIDTTGFVVVTGANKNALGFGTGNNTNPVLDSRYLSAIHTQNAGRPITVDAFRRAENIDWIHQDPSITVGLPLESGWMTGIEVAEAE